MQSSIEWFTEFLYSHFFFQGPSDWFRRVQETAEAIYAAVTMERKERESRHSYAWKYISRHTAERWAVTFMDTLKDAIAERRDLVAKARAARPKGIQRCGFSRLADAASRR